MPTDPPRAVGRPRDAAVDAALLAATRQELDERGYAGLTVAGVATRAGVGKAAIYRRHATKQEMIFAAAVDGLRDAAPPATGSLLGDLTAAVEAIAAQLSSAPPDVLTGLLADIYADPALGARFSDTFLVRQREVIADALARAVERGELGGQPDATTAQALLIGPVFAWLLILDGDRARVPQLARTVAVAAVVALGDSQ